MTTKKNNKLKSLLLCMMLIVAMALTTVGCGTSNKGGDSQPANEVTETAETTAAQDEETQASEDEETTKAKEEETTETENAEVTDATVLGTGSTVFMFAVVDQDGNQSNFEIHTDKEVVGDALLEVDMIAGDEGEYGLYVKTVNGITADYDVDKTYWAFYINDEYASTGVDSTPVEEGATYTFKIEK